MRDGAANDDATTDRVRFERVETVDGRAFGRATLNAPTTLNALSQDMIDALDAQLARWAGDDDIVGVILDASGDRAFCAGGDVVALVKAIRASADGDVPEAARFFESEYRLDHRIHTYPKPLLCWGHGIVMGGGVGLFIGASHRIATARTRFAMPEITIGLYPDVGGSWMLSRMRGRGGLFLALTAAPLNAADLRHAGLADFVLSDEHRDDAIAAIAECAWSGNADADRALLSHVLERMPRPEGTQVSPLAMHEPLIDAVMGHDALADLAPRVAALSDHEDPWLAAAGATFAKGSPTSAALSYALWRQARHRSLADVFRLEYQASVGCCASHDFPEGVRALLIDKDRKPHWRPAELSAVGDDAIAALLAPRFDGPHPLADLA